MKVLITGHKGFVGRYFWEKLDTVENQLHGIDKSEGNDCGKFFEIVEDHYDLVIHLAAVVGGSETIEGRPLAVESGIKGPVNLGWARATSFIDPAELVSKQNSYATAIITRPQKPIGCMNRVSDNSKPLEFYGPKIALDEGILWRKKELVK
jgi:hypothetical protein